MKMTCSLIRVLAVLAPIAIHSSRSAEFKFPNHNFTLPDGFVIELIAEPPLVDRPIVADFDEQGRLYVADSSGSNDKVDKQLQEKPHRIVRLEDSDGDGKFDRSIVFADKMMFPEGVLWHDGAVYSGAPPTIWKLEDTDGDGVADRRTEWHQGKTLTGCANDLHGPYLGPDGWIYWCKGAFAKQTYERPGRPTISDSAAHIFRCRPDKSEFESVMSGGMDNPVEIAFTPEGEAIFTTTFYTQPEAGKRDALVHCLYGGVYPKVHGVLDGLKRTGDLLPPLTQLGPAVPSGLVRYSSRGFGDDFEGNLFSTQFNLRKVQRHILEPFGATFRSRDIDFLVSDNPDFHPTDVLEDADGSLIVVDTGGWYKLCCPTSQIPKPDVLGAVYRIRKTGASKMNDPRGLKIAWNKLKPKELLPLLRDGRPAVRKRAIEQSAKQGEGAVKTLRALLAEAARPAFRSSPRRDARRPSEQAAIGREDLPGPRRSRGTGRLDDGEKAEAAEARRNAVWALTRIDGPSARETVRAALNDPDPSVQQAAIHSAGLHRDGAAIARLVDILKNGAPHLRRNAATALGRIGDNAAVPALLVAVEDLARQAAGESAESHEKPLSSVPFRMMEHSLIFALIEIGDSQSVRKALPNAGLASSLSSSEKESIHKLSADSKNVPHQGAGRMPVLPYRQRAALIALDEMDGGALTPTDVIPHLESSDPILKETASWIVSHRSEWGKDLSDYFRRRLARPDLSAEELNDLHQQLVQFTRDSTIQHLIAQILADPASPLPARRLLLRVLAKAPLREMPAVWRSELIRCLTDPQESILRGVIAAIRAVPVAKTNAAELAEPLLRFSREKKWPADLRLEALAAVPGTSPSFDAESFDFLRERLNPENPPLERTTAATVLGRAKLEQDQLLALTESLKSSGPMELSKLMSPFENLTNEGVGLKLVAALKESKGLSGLRPDLLKPALAKQSRAVQEQGEELLRILNANLAQQEGRVKELEASLAGGNRDQGRRVFESQKTACSTCHQVGYLGGRVGPDLTKIGAVRTERDLIEAVVFPSASFVRSYESMNVRTKDGEEYSGVLRQEGADSLVLISGANAQQRLAMADVVEMRPGTVSIMPEGMDQQLSKQELADLVAFLKSLK
ncbi:MAG: HEAT repeat domain-containing protein [Verrucomicrobia bacterium]|nr:HEAT repeat domain-containing protein [Verrucomicrobiota bacterium]